MTAGPLPRAAALVVVALVVLATLLAVSPGCSSEDLEKAKEAISTASSLAGTEPSLGSVTPETGTTPVTPPVAATRSEVAFDTVSGTVAYSVRVALPPDAIVQVSLVEDPPISSDAVLVEQVIVTRGRQVPIPFELRFDPLTLDPARTYGVVATISYAGELQFDSGAPVAVVTQGNPTTVDLTLEPKG